MSPSTALAVVALGAFAVWMWTGGASALGLGASSVAQVNKCNQPFLSQTQINYYLSGLAQPLSEGQAAALGAAAGAKFATATFGISVGIGALIGLIAGDPDPARTQRTEFSTRLGFPSLDGRRFAVAPGADPAMRGLGAYLSANGFRELADRSGSMGSNDFEGNARWFLDVLVALWQSCYPFPK